MGGCVSVKFKILKRRSSSKQSFQKSNGSTEECLKDVQMPIPKNGIGRFVQTEEGMVIKTSRDKDEDCHQSDDNHDGQQLEETKHKGSRDEIWFDTHVWLQSDSEDEFESVYGDFLPAIGNITIYPDDGQGSPYPITSLENRTSSLEKKTLGDFFLTTQPQEGNSTLESKQGQPQSNTEVPSDLRQSKVSKKACLPRLLPSASLNRKKRTNKMWWFQGHTSLADGERSS